jgi:hypothetical protein
MAEKKILSDMLIETLATEESPVPKFGGNHRFFVGHFFRAD